MRELLERTAFIVLTLSAAGIAATVVHKEFFPKPAPTELVKSPEYVKNWSALLPAAEVLGKPGAPVTIVEFMDLECPYCSRFHKAVQSLRLKHGTDVSVALLHFPLGIHRFALPAARALECAGEQNHFEPFLDEVYAKQDSLGLKPWGSFAHEAGVPDTAAFLQCAAARSPVPRIETGLALAKAIDAAGTPTVFINGWRYDYPPDSTELSRVVEAVVGKKPPFAKGDTAADLRIAGVPLMRAALSVRPGAQ